MAQAVLKNNREHDININYVNPQTQEVAMIVIPGARASELDQNHMIAGEIMADDAAIKAAAKKYPVVKSYFDNGWLQWSASLSLKVEAEKSE